jgi:8-oxo-dGTP diphosphatase
MPCRPPSSVCAVSIVATPQPVPVVCALIERAGRVLLARRPAHKHLPLNWEFPGGKVEPGEDPAAALVREIREELGCAVVLTRALPRFTHDYGAVVIEMIPYVCTLAADSAAPHPHEHVALAWVRPEELRDHDLAPADLPVIQTYLPG